MMKYSQAKIERIRRWSAVWIIPIITILIGCSILFYYYTNQGVEITLIAENADGIVAGKTKIKTLNVDVGTVESVTLNNNYSKAKIKVRLDKKMAGLLSNTTIFWLVNPKIGLTGVSGLETLFSGAYIQLHPGKELMNDERRDSIPEIYNLYMTKPLTSPDDPGVHIELISKQRGTLSIGDPVHFRGFKVGNIEDAKFDLQHRLFHYSLFINAPYDNLVTQNVRFWQESGINFELASDGIKLAVPSLERLLNSGVSFDLPDGASQGDKVRNGTQYDLYADKNSIQESQYTDQQDFILFFNQSIKGLTAGAPVEFKGIRLGTVRQAPYLEYYKDIPREGLFNQPIPVLISIEPQRFSFIKRNDLLEQLESERVKGLRASLNVANFITNGLYVDLNFYDNLPKWEGPQVIDGFPVIPTTNSGLLQIQEKLNVLLDKLQKLPVEPMMNQMTGTLKDIQSFSRSLNKLVNHQDIQNLPKDLGSLLKELDYALKNIQPGTQLHTSILGDLQNLEQVLRELQPLLKTLNGKSNALIFEANKTADPQPKSAK